MTTHDMGQTGPRCPTHVEEMMIPGRYAKDPILQDAHQVVEGNTYFCIECVEELLALHFVDSTRERKGIDDEMAEDTLCQQPSN